MENYGALERPSLRARPSQPGPAAAGSKPGSEPRSTDHKRISQDVGEMSVS